MSASSAALAAIALMLVAGCTNHERAPHDFERMRLQQRYDLWSRSRVFANGASMQLPPAGTIPLEATIGPTPLATGREGGGGGGAGGGAFVTTIPVPVTPALLARGKSRFAIYCAACHGAAGYGGSIVASNMVTMRPPSLHSDEARRFAAGYLFDVMTHGKDRMPAYDWALSPEDRWAVAAYVQQLQHEPATDTAAIADSEYAAMLHAVDSINAARHNEPAGLSLTGAER